MSTTINSSASSPVVQYTIKQVSTKNPVATTKLANQVFVSTSDTVSISVEAKFLSDRSGTVQPLSAGGTQLPPIPR